MCLLSLEGFLYSFHGRPWQGSTWTAWKTWMQIGYSSKRSLLVAGCLPPSHGDLAANTSYTTIFCHRQLRTCPICFFKLKNPGLPPECWDAFDSDDESSGRIEDEHHAIFDCSGYVHAREHFRDLFQSHITTVSQFMNQPGS